MKPKWSKGDALAFKYRVTPFGSDAIVRVIDISSSGRGKKTEHRYLVEDTRVKDTRGWVYENDLWTEADRFIWLGT